MKVQKQQTAFGKCDVISLSLSLSLKNKNELFSTDSYSKLLTAY